MNLFVQHALPELSDLDAAERRRLLEDARGEAFRLHPGRGVRMLFVSMVAAFAVPLLVVLFAPGWASASAMRQVLLMAVPGVIAPVLYAWLQSRALVRVVRLNLPTRGQA